MRWLSKIASALVPLSLMLAPLQARADFSPNSVASRLNRYGDSAKQLNGIYIISNTTYFANIQAAVTAAGTTGTVLISSTYVGVDTYTNPNSIAILDLRPGKTIVQSDTYLPTIQTAGKILGSALPLPLVGTRGGVEAKTCTGTDKVSAIGTDGKPVCTADQTAAGGTGITSLNALVASTQTFAFDATSTAPGVTSSSSTHTFHFPLASGSGSVTSGTVSNAEFVSFIKNNPSTTQTITQSNAANEVLQFKEAASQSAAAIEVIDSASVSKWKVNADGTMTLASTNLNTNLNANFLGGKTLAQLDPLNAIGAMSYSTDASGTVGVIAPNTTVTPKLLIMTGTGTLGAAPVWGTLTGPMLPSTVPLTNQGNTWTTGTQDWSATGETRPDKIGTLAARSATCGLGATYHTIDTHQTFRCDPANTWIIDGGGSGSGSLTDVSLPSTDFTKTGIGTLGFVWGGSNSTGAPTSVDTPNAIVKRDALGNIVVAGITTDGVGAAAIDIPTQTCVAGNLGQVRIMSDTGNHLAVSEGSGPCARVSTATTPFAGDITGTIGNTTVVQLQGRPLLSTAPSAGNVIAWNGSAWAPTAAAGGITVANPSGNVYHVDGVNITSFCSLAASTFTNSMVATVFVDIPEHFTCDPFQAHNTMRLDVTLTRSATAYQMDHAFHICARCRLHGKGVGSDNTPITNLQASSSFPASVADPLVAPTVTLIAAASCPAATALPNGVYQVGIAYVNETGETRESPLTTTAATVNQCLKVTSPGASSNATGYIVYSTLTGGGTHSEEFVDAQTIGTDITWTCGSPVGITCVAGVEAMADADPPMGINSTGALITMGSGSVVHGLRVMSANVSEIGSEVTSLTIDANGIKGGLPAGTDGRTCIVNMKAQETSQIRDISCKNAGSDGVFLNYGIVVEGLNGGRAGNNSEVDDVQVQNANVLQNCGNTAGTSGGTAACNPLGSGFLADQVKSFRGFWGASCFLVDGVSAHCYEYDGVTNPLIPNNVGSMQFANHAEGKNSSMTSGTVVDNQPLLTIHTNMSSTSGSVANMWWKSGAKNSALLGYEGGGNTAFEDDVSGFTTPAGEDQTISLYAIGDDGNHRVTTANFVPLDFWSGFGTTNSNVVQYELVKIATGVDNKLVPCTIADIGKCFGISLGATTTGSKQIDAAIMGVLPGANAGNRGPTVDVVGCAAGQHVYMSPTTAHQVTCSTSRPAVGTIGRALAATAAGAQVPLLIAPLPPQGYQRCELDAGDETMAALSNAQLGPIRSKCWFDSAGTVVEIDFTSDAVGGGGPIFTIERERAAINLQFYTNNLGPGALGATACVNAAGTVSPITGVTCTAGTAWVSSVNAGDRAGFNSGTAGGTAKHVHATVFWTRND